MEMLNAREVDAYMQPHSHKYDILGLMNDINAKLVCDIPVWMQDIDAMAVKHELPQEKWDLPAGSRRFSYSYRPRAIDTTRLDRAWPTNHDEDGQPVAVATGFGLVPLSEVNAAVSGALETLSRMSALADHVENYFGDAE